MFSKKIFIISTLIASFLFVVLYAQSATTISTNISTGGSLTVSGDAVFSSNVGIGTTTPAAELSVVGLFNLNYGTENVFIGRDSGTELTTGNKNTSLGYVTLQSLTTGVKNVAIGRYSGKSLTTGNFNVAIGADSFTSATSSSHNVAIGNGSLNDFTVAGGDYNVAIGDNASRYGGKLSTYEKNVVIGDEADYWNYGNAGGAGNVIIGYKSGYADNGSERYGNVFLGYQAGYSQTGSNKLYIENSSSASPLIYGEFDKDLLNFNGILGINDSSPDFRLEIAVASSTGYFGVSSTAGNDGDVFIIDSSGNTGIGTSTPNKIFHVDSGASATTTVEIGDIYSGTGKTCFNVAQADGSVASFYFAGGAIVVETNACQ